MRYLTLAMTTLVVAGWPKVAIAQLKTEELVGESNLAVQAQIRATATAFLSGGRSESEIRTNWKGFRELETLKGLARGDEPLVKQLAIYAVAEHRPEEQQALEALLILQILHLKPSIPIRVLAPYLGSKNEPLRDFAHQWFESHDRLSKDPLEAGNYKDYADYLAHTLAGNGDVPTAFVEYLFERSPEWALLAFSRGSRARQVVPQFEAIARRLQISGQQGELEHADDEVPSLPLDVSPKQLLLAGHVVSNAIWLKDNRYAEQFQAALPAAKEQLAKLAGHGEWWVRLYVAEIMRRHPELRLNDVLRKLRQDDEEPVRSVAKSVKE